MKQGSVHAARDDLQVLITILRKCVAQLLSANQRGIGAVVKITQITGNGLLQPAETVMPAVAVELGMEITADRDAKFACGGQSRRSQRTLGDQVNHIGTLPGPEPD